MEWQDKDPTYRSWDWVGKAFGYLFVAYLAGGMLMGMAVLGFIMWPVLLVLAVIFLADKFRSKG